MSDEVTEPNGEDTDNEPQGSEPQGAAPEGAPQDQPKGDPDWKALSRKWETQAKRDREARKALEDRLKQAISPDQVADQATRLAEAEARIAEFERRETRHAIAAEAGLPREWWDRLMGSDETELREDAEKVKATLKPTVPALDAKKGQAAPATEAKPDANQLLRLIARG